MKKKDMLVDVKENYWKKCLLLLGLEDATLLSQSIYDFSRRVYVKEDLLYKILLPKYDSTGALRNQSLADEFTIVEKYSGMNGIPKSIEYRKIEDIEVAIYKYIPFKSLDQVQLGLFQLCNILFHLLPILYKLSLQGVCHNDIMPDNILVSKDGMPFLIDFDQAKLLSPREALIRNMFGTGICILTMAEHRSLFIKIKNQLKKYMPPHIRQALHQLRNDLLMRPKRRLPKLPENASPQLKNILEAWKLAQLSPANAPGNMVSYYSFDFEGHHFPGERPWLDRWFVLSRLTAFRGKRILELGCNLGMLSCFLLKETEAAAALAVDYDDTIITAAHKVASALGVSPVYMKINFDDPDNWEKELINFKPDIVFALNVLNWVNDKKRFMSFLGRFQEVIVEGHDDIAEETKRLRDIGFDRIKLIAFSERNRPIISCLKESEITHEISS